MGTRRHWCPEPRVRQGGLKRNCDDAIEQKHALHAKQADRGAAEQASNRDAAAHRKRV
jgi:hypothetical protein